MSCAANLGQDRVIEMLQGLGATEFGKALGPATLLYIYNDYGEIDIAVWLLDRGMDVNAKAAVDADGFGDATALFSTVRSQVNSWANHAGTPPARAFTGLLLYRGADPIVSASLHKQLHPNTARTGYMNIATLHRSSGAYDSISRSR